MVTRLFATAALAFAVSAAAALTAFAPAASATGNSARGLSSTPSHGITCARGIEDMEKEVKVASARGKQQQDALQGIEAARQYCQAGDLVAAEQKLAGVRQLLAGE